MLFALSLAACASVKPGGAERPEHPLGASTPSAKAPDAAIAPAPAAEPESLSGGEGEADSFEPEDGPGTIGRLELDEEASDVASEESPALTEDATPPEAGSPVASVSKEKKAESAHTTTPRRDARARPKPSAALKPAAKTPRREPSTLAQSAEVRAGEWDDNANYRDFQAYLSTRRSAGLTPTDVSKRRFVVVRDRDGRAVPNCRVVVRDRRQRQATLTTQASGRALLFPRAEGLRGNDMTAFTRCQSHTATARFNLNSDDGVVDLRLPTRRVLPQKRSVDVAFVLDTTGSMSEEINAVKATLSQALSRLDLPNVRLRVGLVEYKDRTDSFVTRVFQMTDDVPTLSHRVLSVSASGGGDAPESVNEGLDVALHQLHFNPNSVARIAFLIGDAPPHLDYQNDVSYVDSMRTAARRGIQMFTIAASGMDDLGQLVWRQIAQYTGGTNLFVLRGGAGPQSTGAGDPKSSCGSTHDNYTSGNLDRLIADKVTQQVAALDRNPLRIAGLMADEKAKPCSERLVLAH